MPQELLHRPDVVSRLQQMGRNGVPQGVAARSLSDPARPDRCPSGGREGRCLDVLQPIRRHMAPNQGDKCAGVGKKHEAEIDLLPVGADLEHLG